MWRCALLGHRIDFRADGATMRWACRRCGERAGAKTYPSAAEAAHYARALNHRDSDDLGRRAPLIGMFPLRLWRAIRTRRGR